MPNGEWEGNDQIEERERERQREEKTERVRRKMKKILFLLSLQSIHHLRWARSHFVVCFITAIFIQWSCKVMRRCAGHHFAPLLGTRSQLCYELEARERGQKGRRGRWRELEGGRIRQKDLGVRGQTSSSSPQTIERSSESNRPDGDVRCWPATGAWRSRDGRRLLKFNSLSFPFFNVNKALLRRLHRSAINLDQHFGLMSLFQSLSSLTL